MATRMHLSQTTTTLAWAKIRNAEEVSTLSAKVFLTWCDDTILFRDVTTKEETHYRANDGVHGDGITATVGHRNLPVFAFSETCLRPSIFVLTYPDFKTISVLKSNHMEAYRHLRFSETEYLLALTGLPTYSLEVWNWRSGKLLGTVETGLFSPDQVIRPNRSVPFMAAQYAPELATFVIWEIHLSMEQAFIIRKPTTIPFINIDTKMAFTFGVDNNVYMTDSIGNLHSLLPGAHTPILLWECEEVSGTKETLIQSYKGGFAIHGSTGIISFVKKLDGVYSTQWRISLPIDVTLLRVLNGQLYNITPQGTSYLIDNSENASPNPQSITVPDESKHIVRNFDMINPVGQYIAVVVGYKTIDLIECSSGKNIATTKTQNIVNIRSHPHYPYIAIGNQMGMVTLLSYYTPKKPKIITEFNLSETWIDQLRFAPSGDVLVVNDRYGDFYVITGKIGGRLDITAHFTFEYPDLHFCAQQPTDMIIHLLLLSPMDKDMENTIASNKIHRVTVTLGNRKKTETTITLAERYTSIVASATNPNQYIATPYMKRDIHILEMQGDVIKSIEVIATFNQLPYLEVVSNTHFIVTWGMDGIVCIFDAHTRKIDAVYFAQNRYAHRMRKVRVDPARKYGICLGIQSTLKCFRIDPNYAGSTKITELANSLQNETVAAMFTKATRSFHPTGEDADKTWLEVKQKRELEHERQEHRKERDQIFQEFLNLKEKLTALIDLNEEWPENERLPLQNFNLSKEWAESLFEMARQERELEDRAMKAYVADQNRITQWIIDNTWNRMAVQGCKVRGIFSSICCENYPLLQKDRASEEDLKKVLLWLNTENMVAKVDKFQPWLPKSSEKMIQQLSQAPTFVDEESGFKHSTSSSETEVQDSSQEYIRMKRLKYALTGTSTHNFIEPHPNRYEQMDVVTFQQTFSEKILGELDMYNLRVYFNKQFAGLYKFKQDQMDEVLKRNNRLRKIQSELNILAELKGSNEYFDDVIIDPEYQLDEEPEKIIKVENSEVQITPYISPSKQKLLDEEAYQLEQKRLALLADDFRERALMAMMDGVLEKRWEDEIKKPPPQPECIRTGKNPEEYSKDDIRAINEYDSQQKSLQMERDKYRLMLLEEKSKLQSLQSEMITKFNLKCASMFILKHQVDAAIKQEELKLLRNSMNNFERVQHKRNEIKYMNEITQIKNEVETILQTLEELEKRLSECKVRYDQLQSRDRLLDRQFKSQFGESAPPVIVDQAYKIFKKRPKWITRAWATASILLDISNRVITRNYVKSGAPIPEECYEFLSLLDSLENISSAPNSISPHLWGILCHLRRVKIESEFKLKAQGMQMAEAEATLNAFAKELAAKKARLADIEKERESVRQVYFANLRNRTIQVVMPRGIIEVPLTGHIGDFDGNVLLNTSDIDNINDIIKKAGEIKIKTMTRSAIFRRKIIYKEWEHKMLQMEVKNMQDYLSIIEKCKVTKEVQMYLKRKDLGLADDLSQSALNREIEATRIYLKKSLEEIDTSVEKVKRQLEMKRRENKFLDAEIARINVDVTEQSLFRDYTMEEQERKKQAERMATVVERGKLIRKVQAQHAQILELATMLELQRLRTFPTLHAPKTNPFS